MNTFRTIIALVCLLAGVNAAAQDNKHITVIALDTNAHDWWHLEGNQPATLTAKEIARADSILDVCISEHQVPTGGTALIGTFIGNHTFMKQLVPSVNEKGEIIIWANCFTESAAEWVDDWRKELLIVNDGGAGFFNVLINLSTGQYSALYMNGM